MVRREIVVMVVTDLDLPRTNRTRFLYDFLRRIRQDTYINDSAKTRLCGYARRLVFFGG